MAKITTFNPELDGSLDPAYSYEVYDGHLTEEQIAKIAMELGGVDEEGYEGFAIGKMGEGQWLITYAKAMPWEVEPYGVSGHRVLYDQQGKLTFVVVHCESKSV